MLVAVSGCALFQKEQVSSLVSSLKLPTAQSTTDDTSDTPVRHVVRLEAAVVSRPAADRRIRTLAWEELDESGVMPPEDRQRLNRSGFRVGVSGINIPWAVTSLASERSNASAATLPAHASDFGSHDPKDVALGMPVMIPDGSTTQLELRSAPSLTGIPDGIIPDLPQNVSLENLRCVLTVEAVEYGEGWVVLKFLPQLHFGALTQRFSIDQGRDQLPVRQRIIPLYEQQFELKLHTSDAVVIGYQEHSDRTVGDLFFRSESVASTQESLLILRLNDIEQVTGQKSVLVEYGKY
jgi:hypothetical protein